jgi:hypothetical protein
MEEQSLYVPLAVIGMLTPNRGRHFVVKPILLS